jgi:GTP-binding protein
MRYTTKFLLSALAAAQFPSAELPEIAFLGRSNVGKSSLLNALVGEKAAKVSQTPGRTRAINFFLLNDERLRPQLIFADLPGYGYAKRETLALCICLVDAKIPPQPGDRQLVDWLQAAGRDFLVVATKTDRLSGNERTRNLQALRKGLGVDDLLAVSAKTGAGVKELWAAIEGTKGPRD